MTEPHATRGWSFVPDSSETVEVNGSEIPVTINRQGLCDVPHEYDPRPGSHRIVRAG